MPTPEDIWQKLVAFEALTVRAGAEVCVDKLSLQVVATVQVLRKQGHLHKIERRFRPGMSAPVLVIPKSEDKCSFVVNYNTVDTKPTPQASL